MSKINKFEDLEVWQIARDICMDIEILFNITALGNRLRLVFAVCRLPFAVNRKQKTEKRKTQLTPHRAMKRPWQVRHLGF